VLNAVPVRAQEPRRRLPGAGRTDAGVVLYRRCSGMMGFGAGVCRTRTAVIRWRALVWLPWEAPAGPSNGLRYVLVEPQVLRRQYQLCAETILEGL
jgi:hypothetical protein